LNLVTFNLSGEVVEKKLHILGSNSCQHSVGEIPGSMEI
jgi:hypothetical protein